jgi:hypothetical protein
MRFGLVFVLLLMGSVSAISVCVDNVAPEAPENLSVSGSVGDILIEWSAAVDSPACSGIDYYNISRDGEWIGTTEDLNFVDDASLVSGEYDYTVYAVDMVGGNAGASVKNSVIVNGGGVSGGGSSGSYICKSDWTCGEWTDCVGDERRRICEDVNKCGTPYLKPEVYEECGDGNSGGNSIKLESVIENADIVEPNRFLSAITGAVIGGGVGSAAAGGILLLLAILGFVALKRRR